MISRLLMFGDSVFFGYGASDKERGCGRLLKKKIDIPVVIKAKNNDTTADAMKRLDAFRGSGYSHAVILFGNNDSRLVGVNTSSVPLRQYEENLVRLLEFFKKNSIVPLLCNLQPLDNDGFFRTLPEIKKFIAMDDTPYTWHRRYSDACENIARKMSVGLIDIRSALEARRDEAMYADGLHPNDLGHEIIAGKIYESVMGADN